MIILVMGIGMIVLAAALFISSLIYRNTAGKKIMDELKKEYH